jgi:hypothetical protein
MTTVMEARVRIPPLVNNKIEVPGTNIVFSAACFGGQSDKDWSLGPLQKPSDVAKNPELSRRVNDALWSIGVETAYAPNPTAFNGKVILPPNLHERLKLGEVWIYRNKAEPADATFLHYPRTAGVFSAGGCGMLVIAYKDKLLFGHAGRESLTDRKRVMTEGKEEGRRKDLVDNMLNELQRSFGFRGMEHVHAWPLYFIKPEDFAHRFDDPLPEHQPYNRAAANYLPTRYREFGWVDQFGINIDLPKVAKSQLMEHGVPEENIHLEHCYLSDELPHTRNGGGRYLVAVVRH